MSAVLGLELTWHAHEQSKEWDVVFWECWLIGEWCRSWEDQQKVATLISVRYKTMMRLESCLAGLEVMVNVAYWV